MALPFALSPEYRDRRRRHTVSALAEAIALELGCSPSYALRASVAGRMGTVPKSEGLTARIVAVAEAWCEMTNGSVYGAPADHDELVRVQLRALAGTHLDAACVGALLDLLDSGTAAA